MMSKTTALTDCSAVLSRRCFLARSAMATAALYAAGPLFAAPARAALAQSQVVSLNGPWQVTKAGAEDWVPATVPGCVHTDLLDAGKIPNPFYRDNEKLVQWIGETDWLYRRTFTVEDSLLASKQVLLHCDGLDTLAAIRINGQEVGQTNNMFRSWEFDVRPLLKPGENRIEIRFSSPSGFVEALESKRKENKGVTGRAWLRKQPCHFGWDWAPTLITSGIWRDIYLEPLNEAKLGDVLVLQDHSAKGRVRLTVRLAAQPLSGAPLKARLTLSYGDKTVAREKFKLAGGNGSADLIVKHPKLWWPAGMGAQPLYDLRVELLNDQGTSVDTVNKRIGLRTLKVLEPQGDKPLRFLANGVEFFAKGANWIPADAFSNRVTPERLRQYVVDAVAVNMNMLRFWGGGYYEEDALYDACDEMGLCVWVDFKFACASYPAFDADFVENVRREARDNLKRLRHHPCIAVWCGNNEISLLVKKDWSVVSMAQDGYDYLFKQVLGEEVKAAAPDASYVSGSPDCGDVHYWDVWWGARTFEAYRELSGFMSEFGYQSYPEPRTVYSYTAAEDRVSTMSEVMKWHQRCPQGNDRIKNMTGNYFRPGKDFDSTLWISQLVQAYGIKLGAEYWRQHMPRSMGCLFWQYNDCWPVASWASVDYYGRWKALHYAARHFYAPLLISGLENEKDGTVTVFGTSDLASDTQGTVTWRVTDLAGEQLQERSVSTGLRARNSHVVQILDLAELVQKHGKNNLLVWLELTVDGREVSRNLVSLGRPKDLALQEPNLTTQVESAGPGFRVSLLAQKPALWAWLSLADCDATYSDNFVHLNAGGPVKILVTPKTPLTKEAFTSQLRARSLYDTYC